MVEKVKKNLLHQPGIEPRANAWKAFMLPLHHWCSDVVGLVAVYDTAYEYTAVHSHNLLFQSMHYPFLYQH